MRKTVKVGAHEAIVEVVKLDSGLWDWRITFGNRGIRRNTGRPLPSAEMALNRGRGEAVSALEAMETGL